MPKELISISLRLDPELLEKIDNYCKENGEGRSSFLRRAASDAMAGPVVVSNPGQDHYVTKAEAEEAFLTLAERIQDLEEQVSQLQTLNSPKVEGTLAQMLTTQMGKP